MFRFLTQPDLVAAIPRLRRYARVLTGERTRADDLVHDTLLRGRARQDLAGSGSNLYACLFSIMRDIYVNELGSPQPESRSGARAADGEYSAARLPTTDDGSDDAGEVRHVAQQMSRLPGEQREVLLLAAVEELSYEEIALVLAIPRDVVISRLSLARDNLRHMVAERPTMCGPVGVMGPS